MPTILFKIHNSFFHILCSLIYVRFTCILFCIMKLALYLKTIRSSHRTCSVRKGVLRNFAKFTGKHLCQSLFFNKNAGRTATLLKKSPWHRCFPVNFAKFLRKPYLQNTSGRLLLNNEIPHH